MGRPGSKVAEFTDYPQRPVWITEQFSSEQHKIGQIEELGPVRGLWPNFSKLSDTRHHCHLKRGNPTYVAIWQVDDDLINFVEVIYVGTHENAKY